MAPPKMSKYALRMMKLSGRIFGEYKRPPMPFDISKKAMVSSNERNRWEAFHLMNENTIARTAERPADLESIRKPTYYPAHPQLKDLMSTLRDHGLFRDEHKDILEEMSRMRAARGKPDKIRGPKKDYPPRPWELT